MLFCKKEKGKSPIYPEVVYARTNAEFLNKRFGTKYKAWMKCGWKYDSDTIVWMIPFDGKERCGWRNRIVDADTVREDYVGEKSLMLDGHRHINEYHRIVVKKEAERFVILGLYRYDFENSDERIRRIWIKEKDFI